MKYIWCDIIKRDVIYNKLITEKFIEQNSTKETENEKVREKRVSGKKKWRIVSGGTSGGDSNITLQGHPHPTNLSHQ